MPLVERGDASIAQVVGCCIGCTFIFELVERAPARVASGVLMQPIGHDETNPGPSAHRHGRPGTGP